MKFIGLLESGSVQDSHPLWAPVLPEDVPRLLATWTSEKEDVEPSSFQDRREGGP